LTVDRGAKAAADAGSNEIGIVIGRFRARRDGAILCRTGINEKRRTKESVKRCVWRMLFFSGTPGGEKTQERDGRMRGGREGEVGGGG